jgi:D-glycero-D-manno-heptose 1,7-bisphosphate phosphatase
VLYLFDVDDTLAVGYMDAEDRDVAFRTRRLLPGRSVKLQALRTAGHTVGLVTNQRGVAFGYHTKRDVDQRLEWVIQALALPGYVPLYVCYSHVNGQEPYNDPIDAARAKPSGVMIVDAMIDYPEAAAKGVLYVGDRSEDQEAAADAGVMFQWARVFFGESDSDD